YSFLHDALPIGRLFNINVLSSFKRHNRTWGMPMIWCSVNKNIYLLIINHLPNIILWSWLVIQQFRDIFHGSCSLMLDKIASITKTDIASFSSNQLVESADTSS